MPKKGNPKANKFKNTINKSTGEYKIKFTKSWKAYRSIETADISLMTKRQLKAISRDIDRKIADRIRQFDKQSEVIYSPALEVYLKNTEHLLKRQETGEDLSFSQLRHKMFMFREFARSKTGDVKGAKDWARQQDERIFGKEEYKQKGKKKTRAKHRMSTNERIKFWQVYREFKRLNPDLVREIPSEVLQQIIGDIYMSNPEMDYRNINYADFREVVSILWDTMNGGLKDDDFYQAYRGGEARPRGNVYTGHGDDFK